MRTLVASLQAQATGSDAIKWFEAIPGEQSERGVHFAMPRPLRNRFVHLDLEPDFEDWCRWAVTASIRPEILTLLRFKPALLHDPMSPQTRSDAGAIADSIVSHMSAYMVAAPE